MKVRGVFLQMKCIFSGSRYFPSLLIRSILGALEKLFRFEGPYSFSVLINEAVRLRPYASFGPYSVGFMPPCQLNFLTNIPEQNPYAGGGPVIGKALIVCPVTLVNVSTSLTTFIFLARFLPKFRTGKQNFINGESRTLYIRLHWY
jgi:hypothetical protein